MEAVEISDIRQLIPYFIKYKKIWADYDQEADVLYMHFKKPNLADHSEMTEDDIILRYENEEIVGLSILNASKKVKK